MGGTKCAGNYSPVLVTQVGGPRAAGCWVLGAGVGRPWGTHGGGGSRGRLGGEARPQDARPSRPPPRLADPSLPPTPPALLATRPTRAQLAAKKEGYSDVVYLDAKTDTYLEEVSSCNIFVVKGKTIRTPPLSVRGRAAGRGRGAGPQGGAAGWGRRAGPQGGAAGWGRDMRGTVRPRHARRGPGPAHPLLRAAGARAQSGAAQGGAAAGRVARLAPPHAAAAACAGHDPSGRDAAQHH